MRRDEALARLRAHEAELRAAGVAALWLFGSVARDEAGPESDVDLMFEARAGAMRSYFDVLRARHLCEDALGTPIDFADRTRLKAHLRERVEVEALRAF